MKYTVLQSIYYKDNPIFFDLSLESLYIQTLKPAKIVLIKDGKLNESLENIIAKWSNKLPLQVVGYKENKGLAYALNYGLQFCETEFVARMDSDDICFNNRFEKQIDFFENHTNIQICGTSIEEFYTSTSGKKYKKIRLYSSFINNKSKNLFKGTPLAHPSVMMKTTLLNKYKYDEMSRLNEDIDLWFRMLLDGYEISNIAEPLLHFRITDATFKRRSFNKAIEEYKTYQKYLFKIFGISPYSIYPFLRLCTRFLPSAINKKIYFSNLRNKLFIKE